jgi:hypothetical protein
VGARDRSTPHTSWCATVAALARFDTAYCGNRCPCQIDTAAVPPSLTHSCSTAHSKLLGSPAQSAASASDERVLYPRLGFPGPRDHALCLRMRGLLSRRFGRSRQVAAGR